jgi:hypothetical protein
MFRKLQFVGMVGLLLASCEPKAILEKFVPKDDDAFAVAFSIPFGRVIMRGRPDA